MKITIENTDTITLLITPDGGKMPGRLWVGTTESGVPVHCFITRISPQTREPEKIVQFENELQETPPPRDDLGAIPLRMIL